MTKTFEEFAEMIYPIAGQNLENKSSAQSYGRQKWSSISKLEEINSGTRLVGNEIYTGGISGGSCWGGENYANVIDHESPEIDCLDDIIQSISPNITYLQYKKLIKNANIETECWSVGEYYGNSSNYIMKYVNLYNLYDAFKDLELV